jgi:hypothetical protein
MSSTQQMMTTKQPKAKATAPEAPKSAKKQKISTALVPAMPEADHAETVMLELAKTNMAKLQQEFETEQLLRLQQTKALSKICSPEQLEQLEALMQPMRKATGATPAAAAAAKKPLAVKPTIAKKKPAFTKHTGWLEYLNGRHKMNALRPEKGKEKLKVTEVVQRAGKRWGEMSAEEKGGYEKVAQEVNKQRAAAVQQEPEVADYDDEPPAAKKSTGDKPAAKKPAAKKPPQSKEDSDDESPAAKKSTGDKPADKKPPPKEDSEDEDSEDEDEEPADEQPANDDDEPQAEEDSDDEDSDEEEPPPVKPAEPMDA